ncbi:sphingomyelin phosphodiesterase-like [Anoplophora glabripennis]|uniref:sphingomyelin phosphodiesterase-like n=1 Tax=Anoplophora glabripennis TaxID=217634 RepID=UPI000873CC2A|nr:sphingomyelin phosphodiesterase-like [Anoplophora glabripennis]
MGAKLFGFVLFCLCVSASTSNTIEDGFQLTTRALTEYLNTGVRPGYFSYALSQCPLPNIFSGHTDVKAALEDSQVCYLCSQIVDLFISKRRQGMTDVEMAKEASDICVTLKIENEKVCDGVINANLGIVTYIIDNNPDLNSTSVCGLALTSYNCDSGNTYEWTVEVPSGNTVEKVKANGTNTFNILHISDIHYDPLYTPGKSSQCGEPLCCQADQDDGSEEGTSCGYWGEYVSGDTPIHTVEEAFKQMATHEFDFVYYTGDTIRHRVWSTSTENNTKEIITITDLFKKYFKVPVFTALGNHEPHPVNTWSSEGVDDPSVSTQWLFNLIAEEWGEWLPEEAKATLLKGGFYTVSPKKSLRIVVLNNNVCYNENWWLINDSKDPYGQLAWLVEVLLEAEKMKENVHLLMHMPTGTGSCLASWSREYRRIISRFANTVTGHFTGHSHKDEMWVFYDSTDSSKPVSVNWNGASLNSDKANPSYKLYQVDGETYDVLDFEEWTFNLTQANLDPTKDVEWYKLYSFKEAYGVDSLEPSAVDDLLVKMTKDHSLIQKYYNFKFRNSDYAVKEGCDESCEKTLLCNMVSTMNGDTTRCEELKQLYDGNQ